MEGVAVGEGDRLGELAMWRSPSDSYWEQGGETVKVIAEEPSGACAMYRVRFSDGEEIWVSGEELCFDGEADPPSLGAAQRELEGF